MLKDKTLDRCAHTHFCIYRLHKCHCPLCDAYNPNHSAILNVVALVAVRREKSICASYAARYVVSTFEMPFSHASPMHCRVALYCVDASPMCIMRDSIGELRHAEGAETNAGPKEKATLCCSHSQPTTAKHTLNA